MVHGSVSHCHSTVRIYSDLIAWTDFYKWKPHSCLRKRDSSVVASFCPIADRADLGGYFFTPG